MTDKENFFDRTTRSLSNKSSKYWARMRTDLLLLSRSDHTNDDILDAVKSELSDLLDSGILNYPPTLAQLGLNKHQSLEERKSAFGIVDAQHYRSSQEMDFLKDMVFKAENARKGNWSWRIGNEAAEKHEQGWHPFFVTLTIDPSRYEPKQVWQDGREFRKYIRRLAKVVCKVLGHPPPHKKPYRPESDYVTYAGVIEHGKSREHHHGHFVIWLRDIPASWKVCPNHGIRDRAKRNRNECLSMRTLWPCSLPGLSPALYFRSVGDVWTTRYNFVLPLDKKTGKSMRISSPRTAGHYITKYLSKEHKEWYHRMKATRNLGIQKLRKVLRAMKYKDVEALTWRPPTSGQNLSLMMTHTVPQGLLRHYAKQQKFFLQYKYRQLDLRDVLQSNRDVFTRMLKSARRGARPERMDSQRFYDWVSGFLPVPIEFSEERMMIAHKKLADHFPPPPPPTNRQSIGGNDIGYS